MRRFIPIIIFAIIGLAFAFGLTRDPRKLDAVLIQTPFPQFSLQSLEDPSARMTEQTLQGQVSMINIFGSWCVACNVEHPVLMDIAAREDIKLIGMNWRDERAQGQVWLAKHGNPYTEIIFDPESLLAVKLGVVGAPETFITDKTGIIRYKHIGPISPEDWTQTLKPVILELRAE
ncbi:MAG: DsbE family thiol:disulfide interchange protein [Litorimonas sp.]